MLAGGLEPSKRFAACRRGGYRCPGRLPPGAARNAEPGHRCHDADTAAAWSDAIERGSNGCFICPLGSRGPPGGVRGDRCHVLEDGAPASNAQVGSVAGRRSGPGTVRASTAGRTPRTPRTISSRVILNKVLPPRSPSDRSAPSPCRCAPRAALAQPSPHPRFTNEEALTTVSRTRVPSLPTECAEAKPKYRFVFGLVISVVPSD